MRWLIWYWHWSWHWHRHSLWNSTSRSFSWGHCWRGVLLRIFLHGSHWHHVIGFSSLSSLIHHYLREYLLILILLVLIHIVYIPADILDPQEVKHIGSPTLDTKEKLQVSIAAGNSGCRVVKPVIDILVGVVELIGDLTNFILKVDSHTD